MSTGIIPIGASRIGYETKGYFRSPDAVFFTFLFPIIMLGIFTAAFSAAGDIQVTPGGEGISVGAYYLPGMLAAGMLLSGVQNLAVDIATEKGDGTLKRLGGTPLSPVSYFLGKIGQVFVTATLQAATPPARRCDAVRHRDADDRRGVAHLRMGVRARRRDLGAARHRPLGRAAIGQERDGRRHPDRARAAVHLRRLPALQHPAGVDAEPREPVPPEVDGAGHALRVPARRRSRCSSRTATWELGWVAFWLVAWLVIGLVVSLLTFRWIRRSA